MNLSDDAHAVIRGGVCGYIGVEMKILGAWKLSSS